MTTDADTSSDASSTTSPIPTGERADLLAMLAKHRFFLRFTARDLTDEQAAARTSVSALCVGGLIKHVLTTEESWRKFAAGVPGGMGDADDQGYEAHADSFRMLPGETLAGLLARYEEVARATDELVATAPDLDLAHPLPEAPWFTPGEAWSVRRVIMHIIAETAQHAGHADIIREGIDGAKSMG
jgi:uncharacterized damage-inducible protein DinB